MRELSLIIAGYSCLGMLFGINDIPKTSANIALYLMGAFLPAVGWFFVGKECGK